jgi:hypothetical protein
VLGPGLQTEERSLRAALREAEDKVHAALLDSIDLSTAMQALLELITRTNKYITAREQQYKSTCRGGCLCKPPHPPSRVLAHTLFEQLLWGNYLCALLQPSCCDSSILENFPWTPFLSIGSLEAGCQLGMRNNITVNPQTPV